MSRPTDRVGDMIETVQEIDLSNRLLDGEVLLNELPEGYDRLVELVSAARAEATPAELAREAEVVAAFAAAVTAVPAGRSRVVRLLGAKAVVVAGVLAFSATGAAAASNHLPGPAQAAISNAASWVGIDIEDGNSTVAPDTDSSSHSSDAGKPTDQPGTSAGDSGNDSRPDCAGNPSASDPGCKGGQNEEHPPNSNANSEATDHSAGPNSTASDASDGVPKGPSK